MDKIKEMLAEAVEKAKVVLKVNKKVIVAFAVGVFVGALF